MKKEKGRNLSVNGKHIVPPPLKPFLRWAGGKRWFVQSHANLLPTKINRYIEPFLGSGAVFFHLRPKSAILGDTNEDLINTYQAVKENWRLVYHYLQRHQRMHTPEYYYRVRNSKLRSSYSRAAQFIYLNRTCWNGVYRVNEKGKFNVPIGDRSSVIFEDDCFEEISRALKGAELKTDDFESFINIAQKGDFIFVDPPYTVLHNNNAFIKYNEKLFSWYDQERLFLALKRAKSRGANIVGTNAYHEGLRNLYEGNFHTFPVSRNSGISSNGESRGKYDELLIMTEPSNG